MWKGSGVVSSGLTLGNALYDVVDSCAGEVTGISVDSIVPGAIVNFELESWR